MEEEEEGLPDEPERQEPAELPGRMAGEGGSADWMGSLAPALSALPLANLAIPGKEACHPSWTFSFSSTFFRWLLISSSDAGANLGRLTGFAFVTQMIIWGRGGGGGIGSLKMVC